MNAPPSRSARPPRLSVEAVRLRCAGAADSASIWRWRNDPDTRAASFDSAPIPWEQHERWFSESLGRDDRKIHVIEANEHPAGVTRLDITGSEAVVSINLAPEWRRLGLGALVLCALADLAFVGLGLRVLRALVKADNVRSLSAFAKAGFTAAPGPDGVIVLEKRSAR